MNKIEQIKAKAADLNYEGSDPYNVLFESVMLAIKDLDDRMSVLEKESIPEEPII